jgi:AcrR family transcriptional regulator
MGRRSEHTLDEIKAMAIAAAEKLVIEHGVSHLTTRKVAAAMGYTSGTLYLVFKNVDDLILQINGRSLDKMQQHMRDFAKGCKAPRERVKALCMGYLDYANLNPNLWSLVFENRWNSGFSRPSWYQAKKMACFAPLEEELKLLAKGRSEDEVALAAGALWSAVHGVQVLHATGKLEAARTSPLERLAVFQVENFLRGFLNGAKADARLKS